MEHDFSKGGMGKNILLQAVPLTIAQLIQLLYNVVDRIYIGHLPDSDGLALTGVGVTFPVISLVTAFTNLFGMGGSPLFSIARGEGDEKRAGKILGASAWLLFCSSIGIMALCYALMRPLLYLFGASDNTYPYASEYLSYYLLGTAFSMVGTGLNFFINAQGFPRVGMCTTLFGAALNIVLDPLFLFVFHMGVKGAAIATVISQGVSAVWVVRFLMGKRAIIPLRREDLHFSPKLTKEICSLGLSGFIMSATNSLVQVVCNATLNATGGDLYVGVMTVLNSVRDITSLPVNGITSGAQPVLGFNYGAREYGRVKKGILFTLAIGAAYSVAAWALVISLPEFFMRMFTSQPEVIAHGADALKIYFFGFFLMTLQFSGQSTFVALGKSRQAIFFSLLRKVVIVVPLTLLLPQLGFGVNGVFLAEPISNAAGGILCFTTMILTVWRKLSTAEAKQPA